MGFFDEDEKERDAPPVYGPPKLYNPYAAQWDKTFPHEGHTEAKESNPWWDPNGKMDYDLRTSPSKNKVDKELDDFGEGLDAGTGAVDVAEAVIEEDLGPASLVADAGIFGYQMGRKLDEATGASDWISDHMPGGQAARRAEAQLHADGFTDMPADKLRANRCRLDNGIPIGPAGKDPMEEKCGHDAMMQLYAPYAK